MTSMSITRRKDDDMFSIFLLIASAACAERRALVVTDGKDACVCDPYRGRILVVHDSYPATKE